MKIGFLSCFPEYSHKNIICVNFSDSSTILECDMLILELEWLFDDYETSGNFNGIEKLTLYCSTQIEIDMEKRKSELIEFLRSGKPVVILNGNDNYRFRYTGEKGFSGTGKNTRITEYLAEIHPMELLPISIKPLKLEGNITTPKNKKINMFYKKYSNYFKYLTVYDGVSDDKVLLNIKETEKVVSFFEKIQNGILLFLPSLDFDKLTKEKGQRTEKQYFEDIYSLTKTLVNNNDIKLPEYSQKYLLPNEEIMINDIQIKKMELNELQKSIENKEMILKKMQEEKIIFSGSGIALEKLIVQELKQIGFNILKYDENGKEEDIVIEYNKMIAIVEIKGVDGSATEKHTSQTVKWKSMYHIDHDILPKGFLIVNAFKEKELENRQETFPTQMLKYAQQQEICLLTSIQIFNIKCYLNDNPEKKDEILSELYNTVGVYKKFDKWDLYIKAN